MPAARTINRYSEGAGADQIQAVSLLALLENELPRNVRERLEGTDQVVYLHLPDPAE